MRPTIVAHLPQHSWEVLVRLPLAQLLQASTGERQKERGILAVGAYAYESKGECGGDGGGTQTKNLEQLEHITKNITLKKKREKKTQASKKGTSSPQTKQHPRHHHHCLLPQHKELHGRKHHWWGSGGRDLREMNLVEGAWKGNLKEGNGLGH
jgi:hypothetical protein